MSGVLVNKLKKKIEEKNYSVAELERVAGLKGHAIRNILRGRSQKPSIEILQRAASVLGCSILEFLDEKELGQVNLVPQGRPAPSKKETILVKNVSLYEQVVKLVFNIYQEKNYIASTEQASYVINEVYAFAEKNQSNKPDKTFAEWLISNCISS
ncbi:MAG: helix-turn-helix transcriptional regulator [Candidatus Paracaedimonas acanthamoebae]|uniref:Helix-turn-helix transcriptional regulator n=1 Tax=Candidatus Paracaedimonas acanthamoebae TaxID=244581 RepID=A0A8J7PZB8_9PROT|nr:helix-turn-helix transcriptional regulator [Candidatus Paracaedimonas acanthamoebae]